MRRFFVLFLMVFTVALFLLSGEFVRAADQDDKEKPAAKASTETDKDTKGKTADSKKKAGTQGGNSVVTDPIPVEGKVHKPEAYYLLQRSDPDLKSELNDSTSPKALKSVEEQPN